METENKQIVKLFFRVSKSKILLNGKNIKTKGKKGDAVRI